MIYGENQVRQFFVVDADNIPTVKWPSGSNDYYYLKFPATGDNVCSDKIKKSCIRDVRISVPKGYDTYKWTIVLNNTTAGDETYSIKLMFANIFGFGDDDKYIQSVSYHAGANTTAANLATEFEKLLKTMIKNDYILKDRIEVSASGSTITIKEKVQNITKNDIIRGLMRTPMIINNTGNGEVFFEGSANQTSNITATVTRLVDQTSSNAAQVADMEYFFMKGRADKYGYMGFPDINPTEMRVDPSSPNNYVILDIHYFLQEQGMLNQNSEKELTVVIKNLYEESEFSTYVSANGASVGDKIKTGSGSNIKYYIVHTAIAAGNVWDATKANEVTTSVGSAVSIDALEDLIYGATNSHIVLNPATQGNVVQQTTANRTSNIYIVG